MAEVAHMARGAGLWRAGTWMLHVAVSFLAVLSLFSGRFDLWTDLQWMAGWGLGGTVLRRVMLWGWVGSVLLVPLLSGPLLRGIRRPVWVNRPVMGRAARWLLLPTVGLIGCLLVDTWRYYFVVFRGEWPMAVPITAYVAGVLGLWCVCVLRWVRVGAGVAESEEVGRWGQAGAYGLGGMMAVLGCAFFLLHLTASPPGQTVDVAVVLGCRVLPDGRASTVLRERVLAAVELYERGKARHIMLSGIPERMADGKWVSETEAMLRVCVEAGVPREAITLDPLGANTRATAANARQFVRDHGFVTVAACSSASHLPRVRQSFREVGLECATVAAVPAAWTPTDAASVLREFVGLVVYALDPGYRRAKAVEMNLKMPRIVVKKGEGKLELFDGAALVRAYACITGSRAGDKDVEGDRRTPVGTFRVVFRNPDSKYHLSLGLDYPNREYAERGLAKGLITRGQYEDILAALASDLTVEANQKRLWYSPLGGEIFIHGHAEGRTGTAGCVALSNVDIEELYAVVPLGTVVEIRE